MITTSLGLCRKQCALTPRPSACVPYQLGQCVEQDLKRALNSKLSLPVDSGVRQHSCKAQEQLSPWLRHRRTHLIAARLAYPMTVSNCQVEAPAEATAETLAVASRASRHSCASPCQPGQRQANDTRGAYILRRCGLPTKPRAPSADGMLCMLCELGKHYCWALPAQAQTN